MKDRPYPTGAFFKTLNRKEVTLTHLQSFPTPSATWIGSSPMSQRQTALQPALAAARSC